MDMNMHRPDIDLHMQAHRDHLMRNAAQYTAHRADEDAPTTEANAKPNLGHKVRAQVGDMLIAAGSRLKAGVEEASDAMHTPALSPVER
jgi:hypothetical protein